MNRYSIFERLGGPDPHAGSRLSPLYGLGTFIVLADILDELCVEIHARTEGATGHDVALNFGEPEFHLIEQRLNRWISRIFTYPTVLKFEFINAFMGVAA